MSLLQPLARALATRGAAAAAANQSLLAQNCQVLELQVRAGETMRFNKVVEGVMTIQHWKCKPLDPVVLGTFSHLCDVTPL